MIGHYLKSAWRHLARRPGYTLLNVGGLAVGTAVCLTIGLYVRHELSYDEFFPESERTYRIYQNTGSTPNATTPPGLLGVLQGDIPGIERAIYVQPRSDRLLEVDGSSFFERVHHPSAGLYPALFLSGWKPASILRAASSRSAGGNVYLRRGLVVLQFVVTIGLVAATLVVRGQLDYAQEKNLGFDRERLITVSSAPLQDSYALFKERLLGVP